MLGMESCWRFLSWGLEIVINCLCISVFLGGRMFGIKIDYFDVVIGVWVRYEVGMVG